MTTDLELREHIDSVRGYPDDRIAGPLWVKDPIGAYVRVADLAPLFEHLAAFSAEMRALRAVAEAVLRDGPHGKAYRPDLCRCGDLDCATRAALAALEATK